MQKCPKCEKEVADFENPIVITISRMDDTEVERAIAPSIVVKICPECGALYVANENIAFVKQLLDL